VKNILNLYRYHNSKQTTAIKLVYELLFGTDHVACMVKGSRPTPPFPTSPLPFSSKQTLQVVAAFIFMLITLLAKLCTCITCLCGLKTVFVFNLIGEWGDIVGFSLLLEYWPPLSN
jgi:hypothetical protein